MDKREKVIGHLEDCMDVAERTPHEWVFVRTEIVRDALELLKALEPVAPIQGADDQDEDIFCCGSCGAVVGVPFLGPPGECEVQDNYCPNCGRAVKWE